MLSLPISPLLLSVLTQQSSVVFPSHPPCKAKQSTLARALPLFSSQLGEEENSSSGGDRIVEPELSSRSGDGGGRGETASSLYEQD